jgi:uncharacterized protein DUF2877
MRFAALALGAGVPLSDFAGRLVEVHPRAALVELANGELVTLLAPELGRQPHGITVEVPPDLSLRNVLYVGVEAAARAGVLRVAGGLTIDLREAALWRCGLAGLRMDFVNASVARTLSVAWPMLEKDERSSAFLRAAAKALDDLDEAVRRRNVLAAACAISSLIGLGEGRTPEGDDYLVGYFAALWASGEASRNFAGLLAPHLIALAEPTERLSRLYLQSAASGEVTERIAATIVTVAVGDQEAIGLRVAAALAVGHTSGAAAMRGVLRGCGACAAVSDHACAETILPAFPVCSSLRATPRQIAPSST